MAVSNLLFAFRSSRLCFRVCSGRLNEHIFIGKTGFLGFDVPGRTLAAAGPSLRSVRILELRCADILNHGFGLTAILAEVEFRSNAGIPEALVRAADPILLRVHAASGGDWQLC